MISKTNYVLYIHMWHVIDWYNSTDHVHLKIMPIYLYQFTSITNVCAQPHSKSSKLWIFQMHTWMNRCAMCTLHTVVLGAVQSAIVITINTEHVNVYLYLVVLMRLCTQCACAPPTIKWCNEVLLYYMFNCRCTMYEYTMLAVELLLHSCVHKIEFNIWKEEKKKEKRPRFIDVRHFCAIYYNR